MKQQANGPVLATLPLDTAERPKRARSNYLVRYILPSDSHHFIGRIYDLSIIVYQFDSYEELARHADCKYAFNVNLDLTTLTRRVESLNLAGDILWPKPVPANFRDFPVSRYEWLTLAADVFLMRYVSVVDCALLLTNGVFEIGLSASKCSIQSLERRGVPITIINILKQMQHDQGNLRLERNARFHHGHERGFTQDDLTFRSASLYEHRSGRISGTDRFSRKINVERSFKEGLVELQRDFNRATRRLVRHLDLLYDELGDEFEKRFGPRIRNSTHGLRVSR